MSATALKVVALAALATAVVAQAASEQEPNDRAGQAQPIAAGVRLEGRLATTADSDWYAFSLAQPQRVNLRAVPANASLPWAPRETLVAIYDATGRHRLAWDERSERTQSDCGITLPAGDYTCLVALKPTGASCDYVLEFATEAPRTLTVLEGPEPNDNPALGGTPTPFTAGDTLGGEIEATGDVDWFAFHLTEAGIVQVLCLDDGGAPQLDNTRLQFWRETSPGLWSAFGVPSFVRTSHRALDLTHTTHLPAGNYLTPGRYAVQVDANTSTPTGTAPWDYRKVGKYALRTALISLVGTGHVQEAAEPNALAATATPLTLGNDARGTIDEHGDTDWYRFEIAAPTTIGATAEGTGPTAVSVTSIRLCHADGTAIASGTGTAFAHGKLVHTLARPGVYFLEVKGRLFTDTGSYVLHTGSCEPLHVEAPSPLAPGAGSAVEAAARPRPAADPSTARSPDGERAVDRPL